VGWLRLKELEEKFHRKLDFIIERVLIMGQELDVLSAKVDEVVQGEKDMHSLLDAVKAALDNAIASGNPAQLVALSQKLADLSIDQKAAIIADALPPVTPVVPPVVVPPVVVPPAPAPVPDPVPPVVPPVTPSVLGN
jgi:hypothetical protein